MSRLASLGVGSSGDSSSHQRAVFYEWMPASETLLSGGCWRAMKTCHIAGPATVPQWRLHLHIILPGAIPANWLIGATA
jgi:hypothetical protein